MRKERYIVFTNTILDVLSPILVLILGIISSYYIDAAPYENVMGPVQKIMYIHVGSAIACYLMLAVIFISAVYFLVFKDKRFFLLLDSASSISFLFCSIVLITGMIWGHSSWNTWWRWEPRLTSVLILWVILFALRYISWVKFHIEEKSIFMSSLGILSAIQVPIVMFSIKLLNRTEQLHPEVVAKQGLKDSGYVNALIYSNFALMFLAIWLCRIIYRMLLINDQRRSIKRKL